MPSIKPQPERAPRPPVDLLVVPVLLLTAILAGPLLVGSPPAGLGRYGNLLWRLWDEPVHAVQAVLVVSPLVLAAHSRWERWLRLGTGAAVAMAIDVDHLLAAHALSLARAAYLRSRPASHSLLFAVFAGLGVLVLTRRPVYGWLFFAALATHVLYDASGGGTPVFWPLRIYSVPVSLACVLILGLWLVTWLAARKTNLLLR